MYAAPASAFSSSSFLPVMPPFSGKITRSSVYAITSTAAQHGKDCFASPTSFSAVVLEQKRHLHLVVAPPPQWTTGRQLNINEPGPDFFSI